MIFFHREKLEFNRCEGVFDDEDLVDLEGGDVRWEFLWELMEHQNLGLFRKIDDVSTSSLAPNSPQLSTNSSNSSNSSSTLSEVSNLEDLNFAKVVANLAIEAREKISERKRRRNESCQDKVLWLGRNEEGKSEGEKKRRRGNEDKSQFT